MYSNQGSRDLDAWPHVIHLCEHPPLVLRLLLLFFVVLSSNM